MGLLLLLLLGAEGEGGRVTGCWAVAVAGAVPLVFAGGSWPTQAVWMPGQGTTRCLHQQVWTCKRQQVQLQRPLLLLPLLLLALWRSPLRPTCWLPTASRGGGG